MQKLEKTKYIGTILLTLATIYLQACGADENAPLSTAEIERRQDLTFDLSGMYNAKEFTAAAQSAANIEILNEHGFHDIQVNFSLERPLNDSELKKIELALKNKEHRITDEEIQAIQSHLEKALQNLTLGDGNQEQKRGGENIVLDAAGKESEIVVRNSDTTFYEAPFASSVEYYSYNAVLYLTAHAEDDSLDYQITRNTDSYGISSDKQKGLYITINRKYKTTADQSNCDQIIKFKILLDRFAKQ
ncbi:MAG: hypothetical protein R3B45_03140 [Bdellovibrionota bacterium]